MNELALFAGAGGGILGGRLLGWRTVCAVEFDTYAAGVLVARQNDGCLEPFPIWDDVRTFGGRQWRGRIDVISGGFPCQDISVAGNGAGLDGERSGLWVEMARIILEVEPSYVLVENSPALTSRGLGRVLGDLAEMGFDAEWGVLGADDAGAPHVRKRIWILAAHSVRANGRIQPVRQPRREDTTIARDDGQGEHMAHPKGIRGEEGGLAGRAPKEESRPRDNGSDCFPSDADGERPQEQRDFGVSSRQTSSVADSGWWETEPAVGRVANGMAHRVGQLKALGNGQVPVVAAMAWRILYERLNS